jgi:hypothetical protein
MVSRTGLGGNRPPFKMAPERAAEAERIIAFVRDRKAFSYAELSDFLGREVSGSQDVSLLTALRRLEKDKDRPITFINSPGVGYIRNDAQGNITAFAQQRRTRAFRQMGRGLKVAQRTAIEELTRQGRQHRDILINAFSIGRTTLRAGKNTNAEEAKAERRAARKRTEDALGSKYRLPPEE